MFYKFLIEKITFLIPDSASGSLPPGLKGIWRSDGLNRCFSCQTAWCQEISFYLVARNQDWALYMRELIRSFQIAYQFVCGHNIHFGEGEEFLA